MKSVVLGTAGHIDHGKTAVVKALTGVDTDRLEEEQRRGISIDLGFARFEQGDVRFGIVDVPGHERFVKNMLAGVGGIDLVMLVVAADEGVMPQTREHLDILDFLEIRHGFVALTKCDLVDEEMQEIAHLDAEEVLQGTALENAPIVPVSAITGDGIPDLKQILRELAERVEARSDSGPYRLPIDRVFTVEGFGTVVTGTSFAGSVEVGDRLDLKPGDGSVRVRRVQVHGKDAERGCAGQRTALAIHGVDKEDIVRGQQLVAPGSLAESWMVDVRVRVSPRWVRPLRNRERVRVHLGSAEDLARIVLLDRDELAPGEDCLAQLRLESPLVPALGDRFVLRSYSPMHAMAGGTIIDPHPKKHHRFREDELETLHSREGGGPTALLLEAANAAGLIGVKGKDLVKATSLPKEDVETLVEQEVAAGTLRIAANGRILSGDAWRVAGRTLVEAGKSFQERHHLRWGMTREEARAAVGAELTPTLLGELLAELAEAGEIAVEGERFRVGGGEIVFDGAAGKERDRLTAIYRKAGCGPQLWHEIVDSAPDPRLAEEVIAALLDLGELVKITPDLHVHADALANAIAALGRIAERDGAISVGALKDELGISRKYAVPLFEYFDANKITRREGDVRILLGR